MLDGVGAEAGHLAYREHIGGWPGLRFALADIPLLLLCGVTALGVLVGGAASAIPRRILLLMAVLVVWYAAAALGAPDRLLAGFDLLATMRGFAIAWIVASLLRRDLLGAILALLALQVILHSSFAVAQGVTGRPIGAGWFGGLDELLGEPLAGRGLVRRPAGLFTHPITYAGALLITLPLLLPNLLVVLVLAAIRAVQIFDEVFVLTGGGPGSATTFVVQFIYQTGFQEQVRLYGLAAAGSLLLALALVVLTLIQLRATRATLGGSRAARRGPP